MSQIDDFLAGRLSKKPVSIDEFMKGFAEKSRTWLEAGQDLNASVLGGINSLAKIPAMAIDKAVTGNWMGPGVEALGNFGEAIDLQKSDYLRAKEAAQQATITKVGKSAKEWGGDGYLGTAARVAAELGTGIGTALADPALLVSGLAGQLPQLGVMGIGARGANIAAQGMAKVAPASLVTSKTGQAALAGAGTAGAVGMGATLQGADVGSDVYRQMLALPESDWLNHPDYKALAEQIGPDAAKQKIASSEGMGVAGKAALATLLTSMLPGGSSIESVIAGKGIKPTLKSVLGAVKGEARQEALEEGFGKLYGNQAVASAKWDQDLAEGVGGAAGQGAVLGGLLGGGVSSAGAAKKYFYDKATGLLKPQEDRDQAPPATSPSPAVIHAAAAPDTSAAEAALLTPGTPLNLTALDRVNEIDTADRALQARVTELNDPAGGYGPMFDQERGEVAAQQAVLAQEKQELSKDWPKAALGLASSFTTEAGARVEAQYALMEAADLVTSHDESLRRNPAYPAELQPRERDRAASEMQVSSIVQKLDPARLGLSADAANGAPIVGADGLVESGNARTIALKRVYQANGQKAADYKQFLQDNAVQFGLGPDAVGAMARPVLVRVRSTPVNRAEFARQANAPTVAQMSPSEQAKSDATRVDSMEDLAPDDNGDFSNAASRPFIRRFMARLPITEQAGMMDADGNLSTTGYARVRNAVLAKAYGDSPVLARITESMDDNLRNVSRALMLAAPRVAQMREAVQAGNRFDADITPDLMAAVEELSRVKTDGRSVQDTLAQADLMGEQRTLEARQMLGFLNDNLRRPRRMADFINAYMDALDAAGDPKQSSMFGESEAPTKQDLLNAATQATQDESQISGSKNAGVDAPVDAQAGQKPEDATGGGASPESDGGVAAEGAAAAATKPAGQPAAAPAVEPANGSIPAISVIPKATPTAEAPIPPTSPTPAVPPGNAGNTGLIAGVPVSWLLANGKRASGEVVRASAGGEVTVKVTGAEEGAGAKAGSVFVVPQAKLVVAELVVDAADQAAIQQEAPAALAPASSKADSGTAIAADTRTPVQFDTGAFINPATDGKWELNGKTFDTLDAAKAQDRADGVVGRQKLMDSQTKPVTPQVAAPAGFTPLGKSPENLIVTNVGDKPKVAPTAPAEEKTDALKEQEKAAKAKMLGAAAKLAQLLSKNTRMNITPEQEQAMLPIVIELFEGAMDLGYIKFKQAARYVREYLASAIDQDAADSIPIDTLQGAYIATSRRHKDKAITPKVEVVAIDSIEELENDDENADTSITEDVANDNPDTPSQPGPQPAIPAGPIVQNRKPAKVRGNAGGVRGGNIESATGNASRGADKNAGPDYVPDAKGLTRTGSWFETAKRNIDLIELAIKIDAEKRPATPQEQEQLSKYVGFGASAIRNDLFPIPHEYAKKQDPTRLIWPNMVRDAKWKPLAERLEALPREWQQSILQSSQYANYTSEGIIRSVWSALERMGFKGGNVFEPGMGIGSFSMLMPKAIREESRYTGIEFDGPTALIARLLSPQQNMIHGDFINRKFPKNFFDVNVGNPPFSQTKIFGDPDYAKQGFMLHDFFFAKGIDLVRPGGVQVFVTSKGTMDKQSDKARKYLSDRADLLGAIRLPSTAFEDNAGTSVVTDVIFLRKRAPGEAPAGQPWNNVATVETPDGPVVVNEYFAANPHMVLGQQRISGNVDDAGRRIHSNGRGIEKYTVVSYDKTAEELDAKFATAIQKLPENAYTPPAEGQAKAKAEKVDFDPAVKREGVIYLGKDGALMRVAQGVGKPLNSMTSVSDKDRAWFKSYVGLRDLVQTARFDQLNDGDWEKSLAKLNKGYDAFRKEHGPVKDFRVMVRKSTDEDGKVIETESRIFKNRKLYREDYDSALITSLEDINEDGEIVKAPFLKGRTIGKPVERVVRSIGDALAVSLDERGSLDAEDVGKRLGLSKDEAIEALDSQIYQAPSGEWQLADEYLSGDVVAKLEEADQAARLRPDLRRNVQALKDVQPEKLGPSQISAKLGSSWIPEAHVNEFADEIGAGAVTFDAKTETWQVDGGNLRSQRMAGAEYGTAKRSPSELLEAILNSRSIKVTETVDKKTVTDEAGTTAANEMAKKIKDKFKGWVWTDTDRSTELVEKYNRQFNNLAPRRFDGSHLTLPGVSLRFKLHPHQLRAIWRMIQTGNTYLAHAVGAGKTIEMIAGGMEQKRLGLIKKPIYVVPNHMLEQFSNEFMELYPMANIMVADDENFSPERRKAFVASATLNNPDAIVITHDAFQRIGVKEESVAPIRDEILADLEIELSETAKGNETRVRRGQLEQQIEAVKQRFDRIIGAGAKDSTVKFEDMGVDFVFADEAHVFRKLDFHTAQQIKGIDPNGSKRALDMYVKTRILDGRRPGRSMVFASGTPVTNTMGELYTIMRFFGAEELDKGGISTFDAWARQFGEVAPALEPNAAGKYELIERFAKFDNVPELMSRVRQFMDVLTSENLGALVKRPDIKGGKPNLNIILTNESLLKYMKEDLAARIEVSRAWKPSKSEPHNPDPIVAIITDGRFAALDPRFFGGKLEEGETSLLMEMGKGVVTSYHATKDNAYTDKAGKEEAIKGATQLVFYNLGFGEQSQKNRGFNSRAAFTKILTDGGIPRSEIVWFDDANTDAKKETVFKDMRSGKVKILIGSAKKMGTGVNVQKRLAVLHYQDPPWFPADVEQPHGRIIRQGNQNAEGAIEWYTTKGTYQSTMWQMVGRKQRFIDQAFTGDKNLRSMDDLGEASLFEQAAAVASGDPRAIQLAGLRQDVQRFERLQAAHASEQINVAGSLRSAQWHITSAQGKIKTYAKAFAAIGEKYFSFSDGKVGNANFTKPGEFGQAIKNAFNKVAADAVMATKPVEDKVLATLGDAITVYMDQDVDGKGVPGASFGLSVSFGGLTLNMGHSEAMGADVDAAGLARRIFNQVNSVDQDLRKAKADLVSNETDSNKLRKKLGAPFEYQQEMAEKYAELKRLEAELQAEGATPAAKPSMATDAALTPVEAGSSINPKQTGAPEGKPTMLSRKQQLDDPTLGWNTSPDALRTMLGTPGYSQRNLAPIMRNVVAARAIRDQLDRINRQFDTAGHVSDQGLISLSKTTPDYIAAIKEFAQTHGLTVVVRQSDTPDANPRLVAQGFTRYSAPTENTPLGIGRGWRGSNSVAYFWSPSGTGVTDTTPLFSRAGTGIGMDVLALERLARRIQKRLPNMPRVNVLADPSAAPEALRDYIQAQGAWDDVEGATHKGELYLFASNLSGELRAEHVLAEHEAAHFGLSAILGDSLKGVMQAIYNNNATVRQAATDLQGRGKLSNAEAAEEVIVDIPSKDLIKLKGWRKLTVQVRDWLADHGFERLAAQLSGWLDGSLNDQQRADLFVANLVRAARGYVAGKKSRTSSMGSPHGDTRLSSTLADDVAKQEQWLRVEAQSRGYQDIDQLAEKNYPLFEKLAELWRKKNPAEGGVLLSRAPLVGTATERADKTIQTSAATAKPLDKLARGLTRMTGIERATSAIYDKAGFCLDRWTPETVKAGMVSDYGVPEAVIDQRAMLQGRQRVQLRQAGSLIEKLATLTRAESRVAYEWMNETDPHSIYSMMQGLPEESVKVLMEVQGMIDKLSKEAVRMGQLSPEAYEASKFAYLRRSYAKYTFNQTAGEKTNRARTISVLGDQYKGRGLTEAATMAQIQSSAPEWWARKLVEGKADIALKGEKFLRLERRTPSGERTKPLDGMDGKQIGKLKEVHYFPVSEKLPAKYADWTQVGTFEVRDTKGAKVVLWRDFTKDERESMGEIDEARFAIAKTLHAMIHDVEVGRYLEWLAHNQAKKEGETIPGTVVNASEKMQDVFKPGEWVKVPDSTIAGTSVLKYGKLAGRYLPGPVWNDLRQTVNGQFKPLGETYAKILTVWKLSKTALSPTVHINNIMSNFVMADWHDVSAGHTAKALRILLGGYEQDGKGVLGAVGNKVAGALGSNDRAAATEVMNRYLDSGGNIGSWATNEITKNQVGPLLAAMEAELAASNGNSQSAQIGVMSALQHVLMLRLPSAFAALKDSKPGKAARVEASAMIDLYQSEDDVFRLAAWLKAKEEGKTDMQAGKIARRSFMDYHINAPWVQALRNSVLPFVAYTYRAIPMLLETAGKKPHKLMKLMLLVGGLNALGVLLAGGDDEERKLLPEEKAGRIWGLVPKLIRMPWNDANASPVYLDIRRFIPMGDVLDVGANNAAIPMLPMMTPGGPLVIMAEVVLNKTGFTGKPITLETDTAAEQAAKVLDHLYKSFAPNLLGLPGTYATTGVFNAARGVTDKFGREQSVAQAMASSFGVKLESYPADVLRKNAQGRAQFQIMEIDRNISALKRQRQINKIDDDEFVQKVQAQQEKKRRVMQGLGEKLAQ